MNLWNIYTEVYDWLEIRIFHLLNKRRQQWRFRRYIWRKDPFCYYCREKTVLELDGDIALHDRAAVFCSPVHGEQRKIACNKCTRLKAAERQFATVIVPKRHGQASYLHMLNPHCFWCGIETVLAPFPKPSGWKPPANEATIDHLRTRNDPTRSEPAKPQERRHVLACYKCNNGRNAEEQKKRDADPAVIAERQAEYQRYLARKYSETSE